MRLILAFQCFFKILFSGVFAQKVRSLGMDNKSIKPTQLPKNEPKPPEKQQETKDSSLLLLSLMQREARLIDFLMEDITEYSNEQVGAAIRDVHKKASGILKRCYDPIALVAQEGEVDLEVAYNAEVWDVSGKIPQAGSFKAEVIHSGWMAQKLELPVWKGSLANRMLISPAQAEAL
jgi:hypothetical protein